MEREADRRFAKFVRAMDEYVLFLVRMEIALDKTADRQVRMHKLEEEAKEDSF